MKTSMETSGLISQDFTDAALDRSFVNNFSDRDIFKGDSPGLEQRNFGRVLSSRLESGDNVPQFDKFFPVSFAAFNRGDELPRFDFALLDRVDNHPPSPRHDFFVDFAADQHVPSG